MPQSVSIYSINDKIRKVEYYAWPNSTLTICAITLENGFSVRGESACADPALYNSEIGKEFAYKDAYAKIWSLEGYLLKQRMYEAAHHPVNHPVNHPLDVDTILANNRPNPAHGTPKPGNHNPVA